VNTVIAVYVGIHIVIIITCAVIEWRRTRGEQTNKEGSDV